MNKTFSPRQKGNRLKKIDGSFGTEQYSYSSSGQRFFKRTDGGERYTLFGINGERLAVYQAFSSGFSNLSRSMYFAGKLIRSGHVPVTVDRLGSVRNYYDVMDNDERDVSNYFPFGEEQTATSQNRQKFATYYRDSNTSLDYAMNR